MTWLLLQLHSEFSSAGAWNAPLIKLPMSPSDLKAEGSAQQGDQELGCFKDTLGEFKFRCVCAYWGMRSSVGITGQYQHDMMLQHDFLMHNLHPQA